MRWCRYCISYLVRMYTKQEWFHIFRTDFFSSFFSLIITFASKLNSQEVSPPAIFWTSRGHRCRPFPPVRAFNFYRAQGSASLLVDFHRMLLTQAMYVLIRDLSTYFLKVCTTQHLGLDVLIVTWYRGRHYYVKYELSVCTHTQSGDLMRRHCTVYAQ